MKTEQANKKIFMQSSLLFQGARFGGILSRMLLKNQ